ncbi:Protein-glutamate methylesterase/protein-glutamine glutaminase [Dyadobacter sp. CECT 9623]|uniref:Protein-glutamate methylesterase/protein-glutamine glutaminase n=1 Tax=Dyadobacter linearis TaxID=2823330 RepID=A0ABM8UZG9_9BACT|nr:CheR family methyltransferase [Dyadobacter sp. CECT 9623]CAG5074794.1 Protein-glutamate methylesterase/protein-glutamine glutaminase [Dyadobacter sp. CECT 9623]
MTDPGPTSQTENTQYTNLQPGKKPVPIVAIGGSAGGQQAMSELLSFLPADTGLAYVYIQHLSPDHDSKLESILSSKTSMQVLEADHLMPVQPDHLYVIPPGKAMEVIDGVLVLTPRKPKPEPHLPIDQFFCSLAERQKDGAIGIVLSGMASDGTLGLKAIKVAGGITFAQDESAAFQGMPQSAIMEGVVDMVLPPKDIAAELSRLSNHKEVFQLTAETNEVAQDDTDSEDLRKILAFVKSAAGVDFTHYKKATIRRRIIRRMLLYKIDTLAGYIDYLKKHPAEAGTLYNDLLINVTNFFRDAPAMEYLKKQVLPQLIRNKAASEAVRIWVAGCSTGQEAYSMAMMMLEVLGDRAASLPVQIFATDLSDTAIAKARLGVFTKSELTDVSPARLERFFFKVDDHYRVNKLVRDICVFAPHNLLSDPPFSRLDLISCRNLLIYLDDALQKKVFATFHYALKPDGYLLLGKSESVGSSPAYFTQLEKAQKVFARKNNTQTKIPLDMDFKSNTPVVPIITVTTKTTELASVSDLDKLVDNLLLAQYVPASVVIDQDLEIIQFRGNMTPFLQPSSGKASLNLTKMAHPSLVFELRNIVHKARKSAERQRKDGLEISYPDKPVYVNIEAVPITNPSNQQLFLVLFEQVSENLALTTDTGDTGQRSRQLEAELAALRQDMHSIVEEQEASNEELQSANEEVVSSNEELQSINEELETSKEEIESANEELQTINQELQTRNDQLTESYEYSEAILSTINEATLVLDEHLRIKSANQAFYRFFLTDAARTEGQLIYELGSRQLDFSELRDLLHQVTINDTVVKGIEADVRISATQQRTMLIHARKLTLHRKQIILLGFEDITVHRREQRLLLDRKQWFEKLVDNAPAMIWVRGADGKINFLNKAWVIFTGQAHLENEAAFNEAIHPADLPSYQDAFSKNLGRQTEFSFEYRLKRSDGDYRWVLENASPVFLEDGTFNGYTGSGVDIHLQKTLTEQLNEHVDQKTAALQDANQLLTRAADRLQSVLNGVPASVTLMEPIYAEDGSVIDFTTSVFNGKTLEFTQQSRQHTLEKTLLEVTPALKEAGLFEKYVQVLATGESAYQEFSPLPGQLTLAFFITRQVDRTGIVVTVLDITARKQAEIKLTEVVESLQAVLDSSPASIAFFKAVDSAERHPADFTLVVCNSKFSTDFGKPVSELVGTAASGLLSLQHQQNIQEVYATKAPFYEEHLLDGLPKWLATSMTRHDHGVAITELDITRLKESSFQQTKLIKQLQSSNEMVESLATMKEYVQHRGSFLRSSFHDLRGSFGIIVGATSLFKMMDTQQEREKILDMLQRNLTQVSAMMNQLLDYSRLESGEEKLRIGTFDAATLLTELCSGSSQLAHEKSLYIHFEGPDQLTVEGDDVKVRRIAQNLILNALKYTAQGGVNVSWAVVGPYQDGGQLWELIVADTGPGIPQELLAKMNGVEAKDHDAEHQANTQGHGEGIGLFIIKRLTELLNAKMEIKSASGQGTTFRLIFPQSYAAHVIKE